MQLNQITTFKLLILHSIRAVIKQGEGGYCRAEDTCQYKTLFGLKCVIGHLIPDDKYKSDVDSGHLTTSYVVANFVVPYLHPKFPKLTEKQLAMLLNLQNVHDRASEMGTKDFVVNFKRMVALAIKNKTLYAYCLEVFK
jgi:hypothetical protein